MQFFHWVTDFQLYRQQTPKSHQETYEEFLPRRYNKQVAAGIQPVRLLAEDEWKKEGNHYYNIHPRLVSKLCKVDLSKIPSNLFKMPHGLPCVNIRFTQQHDEFTVYEEQRSDFTAQLSNTTGTAAAGSFVHSVLMREYMINGIKAILFIMDFNQFTRLNQPIYSIFQITPNPDKSMQDCIDETKGKVRSPSFNNMIDNVIRLSVTIGFLSNNPSICEADVLENDRTEFSQSNDDRREFIASRARRRGKHGYNVGTDLMFLGERPISSRQSSEATGRELEYAHIRSGHPHAVRYGEGKKLVKIMWYVPTTVRPDLKFKE